MTSREALTLRHTPTRTPTYFVVGCWWMLAVCCTGSSHGVKLCQAMSSYRDGSSHLFHLQGQTTLFGVFNHCSPYTELTHPTKTTQRCKYKPEAKVGGPGAKVTEGQGVQKNFTPPNGQSTDGIVISLPRNNPPG